MNSFAKASPIAAVSLIKRYVWLVDTVRNAGHITFEEISEKWCSSSLNERKDNLPLRTFHHHRKAILDFFGIKIDCHKNNSYTYFIEDFGDIEQQTLISWLLNSASVNNMICESRDLKDRILVEPISGGQAHLAPIINAMRNGVCLELTYKSFKHEAASVFVIAPYCLKMFHQRWYLLGMSDKLRVYGLDRVQFLVAKEKTFVFPEDFDPKSYFINCFGILSNGQAESIVIKVFKEENKDKYLKSLPLHHSQKVEMETDVFTLFSYFMQPTYDFRQELLSLGCEIEVLSPKWFRDEISEIVENQVLLYRTV